jgi:hypothetical protein
MELNKLIIEVLNKGATLKSKEILHRITILKPNNIYTVTDINKTIYHELKNKVNYDKLTYKYYLSTKVEYNNVLSNSELIKKTLEMNNKSMSLIDISYFIKLKYKKYLKIDEIQIILLLDLRDIIGIDNDNIAIVKYYINY